MEPVVTKVPGLGAPYGSHGWVGAGGECGRGVGLCRSHNPMLPSCDGDYCADRSPHRYPATRASEKSCSSKLTMTRSSVSSRSPTM